MKKLLLPILLLITVSSFSQVNLRIGPIASYFHESFAAGGEFVVYGKSNRLQFGAGVSALQFENSGVMPFMFLTAGYQITDNLSFHIDPGYNLYKKLTDIFGLTIKTSGRYYLGSGIKYDFGKHFYTNLQYSLYTLKSTYPARKSITGESHAATLSFGYFFEN